MNAPRPAGRRRLAAIAVGVLGALLAVSATQPASAAPGKADDAVIRAAHFSPTTPGVDVYLSPFSGTSKLWLSGVSYGAVSPYQDIKAGLYTVSMRPHGASASTKPVLSWTLNARAGQAYTAAGIGSGASVKGVVIHDDLSTPPAGKGRVRVIQAASRAPTVTITAANGPVIARDATFAHTTGYATVPAGTWPVKVQGSDQSTSGSVQVTSGSVTSILLLDAKSSGITLRTVLDASAAQTTPRGSVPAGGGGMAAVISGHPRAAASGGISALQVSGWVALALLSVAGVLLVARRRGFGGGRLTAAASPGSRHSE